MSVSQVSSMLHAVVSFACAWFFFWLAVAFRPDAPMQLRVLAVLIGWVLVVVGWLYFRESQPR